MNNEKKKRLTLIAWVNTLHKQGLISSEKYALMVKEIEKIK